MIALEYHDVIIGDDFDASGFAGGLAATYKLRARDFVAHLEAVGAVCHKAGGRVHDVLRGLADDDAVLFTFDDGGVSFVDPIAGELDRRGWRGHFFITTNLIGTRGFVNSAQVRELHDRGHIVGSHSCSHPIRMSTCARPQLVDEWRVSVDRLSEIIGDSVTVASVPGGYFSRVVAETAAAGGIRILFTSEPTTHVTFVDGCMVLGRYTLRREDAPNVAAALVGRGGRARAEQWLVWNAKKLAKAAAGPAYLKLRARLLGGR